jgi:CheY-like chemotaxis protein/HPt (histidine-containing phosphotransfer) domain-containing protein
MSDPAKRVVLIDDSEIILESVKLALEELGCDVEAMPEPARSCFSPETTAPDLVLLDVNMPQAYGDDIARFLRDVCELTSPIYLYSSLSEEELGARAAEAGADGFICKSWGRERLIAAVREILGLPDSEPVVPAVEIEGADGLSDALYKASEQLAVEERQERASVHERFAARCVERRERILALLETADRMDLDHAVRTIAVQLHDIVGESKLLGLDRVAAAASSIKDVVERRGAELFSGAARQTFERALRKLSDVAERAALEAPEAELWDDLRSLRESYIDDLVASEEGGATRSEDNLQQLRRILIVDDSPIIGEVLSLELEARGHTVALATDLSSFNRQMAEFQPELLFLDVNMPEMDGVELCKRLRQDQRTRSLPVIFLSSLAEAELEELARVSGADGFLSKQRGMDDLINYLDELLMEIVF